MPLDELATRLSVSTAEIEGIERRGVSDEDGNLDLFRIGKVVAADKHPNADRLQLCRVDVGEGEPRQIVCGAWNFGAGATVAVALPGAVLPGGLKLDQRKVRGELSDGMILAEDEIELGTDHSGIMLLHQVEPGTPLVDVLPLRTTCCSSSRPATVPTCSRCTASRARWLRSTTSSSHRRPESIPSRPETSPWTSPSTTSKAVRATSAGSSGTSRSALRPCG
jgi:phenylalanyl-tRNA synthetase beta chain